MKKYLFSLMLVCSVVFAFGQNLSIHLNNDERGTLHKVANESTYRMFFTISGLNTDQTVQDFITKCKEIPGVVEVSVKGSNPEGNRPALLVVDSKKDEVFFANFLTHVGITKIYSNDKEYTPETLQQLANDRKIANETKSQKTGKK